MTPIWCSTRISVSLHLVFLWSSHDLLVTISLLGQIWSHRVLTSYVSKAARPSSGVCRCDKTPVKGKVVEEGTILLPGPGYSSLLWGSQSRNLKHLVIFGQ